MTDDQVYLLRKSFHRVEQQSRVAALVFYRRLFELDPRVRPLFKTDIEEQSGKLMDMLGLVLSLSERPERLRTELRELGARHVGYGVRNEHYETVGRALLDMFAQVLAEDFTPPIRSAWTEFYKFMANAMKEPEINEKELGGIAERLAESQDPAEIARLKSAMTRGFHGSKETAASEEL